MSYTSNGLAAFGHGAVSISCGDQGEIKEYKPRADWVPVDSWEPITIGELINRNPHFNGTLSIGRLKEGELAFKVLTNYADVTASTKCEIGTAKRRKAIRIGRIEYRDIDGRLYDKDIGTVA
jgi:hypothetical protein